MTDIERKGVNVLTANIKATKSETGGYDIVLSMPTVDRDGEIIDARAFEPLPADRIAIDVDHGMTVLTTVGSGVAEYEGDILMLRDFRFATTPLGKDVQTLVDEGHVSKMSVAFMDAIREVDEADGKPHVRKAELLNAAIVAIPSNREASILAAKAAIALTDKSAVLTEDTEPATDGATGVCQTCGHAPAATDPEDTAADEAAVDPPADVLLAQAAASIAAAELSLLP